MAEYRDIAPLKQQISNFKKAVNSPNSDYVTGYVSALSATEGIIAGLPTADVVPRKELTALKKENERLRHILDCYAVQYRTVRDCEVAEVVRWKNCTEWDKDEGECSHWYGFRENDFCSYGEREKK